MLKLVLCLIGSVAAALQLCQMRQERLELNYQANELHQQIESQQAKLWNQQMLMSVYMAPNSVNNNLANSNVKLAPEKPRPADARASADNSFREP
jgi:hypothetical protein